MAAVDPDKATRYSLPEIERRFLLHALPDDARDPRRVHDRYLDGGHLRLRRVETLAGEPIEWKLGHKLRLDPTTPRVVLHTSMYLTEAEYRLFEDLPGHALVKVRHAVDEGSVDVHADGMVILEVDFRSVEAARAYSPPGHAIRDVTDDEAFTGGGLAAPG